MREWDRNVLRKGIYMSRTNARGKNSRPPRDKRVKSETPASGADSAIISLRDDTTTELAPGARLTYRFVRPTQTALLRLASSDETVRRKAVLELVAKDLNDGAEETQPFAQRTVSLLEDEWASITSEKDRVIGSLSRIIADPQTDLLSVNILAYALASAGEDGVTELLGLLEHDDFSVNTYAAEGIGALDNRARWAVPALIRFLERAHQPWTHDTIIRALGNIGGAEAISVLQAVAAGARQQAPVDDDLLRSLEGALASALVQC